MWRDFRSTWYVSSLLSYSSKADVKQDNDGNNPKVRVRRWPGAEKDFNSPGFRFFATVTVGTNPRAQHNRRKNIEKVKAQFAAMDRMEMEEERVAAETAEL